MNNKFVMSLILFALLTVTISPTFASWFSWGESTLEEKAENGDVQAQFELGYKYMKVNEISKDYTEAVKWFSKATEQGHIEAKIWLANMYATGSGVDKNYTEAVRLYREVAEQGNAEAQNRLGSMYYNGYLVTCTIVDMESQKMILLH